MTKTATTSDVGGCGCGGGGLVLLLSEIHKVSGAQYRMQSGKCLPGQLHLPASTAMPTFPPQCLVAVVYVILLFHSVPFKKHPQRCSSRWDWVSGRFPLFPLFFSRIRNVSRETWARELWLSHSRWTGFDECNRGSTLTRDGKTLFYSLVIITFLVEIFLTKNWYEFGTEFAGSWAETGFEIIINRYYRAGRKFSSLSE